jgi:hypothetical protein
MNASTFAWNCFTAWLVSTFLRCFQAFESPSLHFFFAKETTRTCAFWRHVWETVPNLWRIELKMVKLPCTLSSGNNFRILQFHYYRPSSAVIAATAFSRLRCDFVHLGRVTPGHLESRNTCPPMCPIARCLLSIRRPWLHIKQHHPPKSWTSKLQVTLRAVQTTVRSSRWCDGTEQESAHHSKQSTP